MGPHGPYSGWNYVGRRGKNRRVTFWPPPPPPPTNLAPPLYSQPIPSSPSVASPHKKPDIDFGDEFENSTLGEFIRYLDGRENRLSITVSSAFGLDHWSYELKNRPVPSIENKQRLKIRLIQLAQASPYKLNQAILNKKLKDLLGVEFDWVVAEEPW